LSKLDRVSRQIDHTTLKSLPGQWAVIQVDGTLLNPAPDSTGNKCMALLATRNSLNIYEANDVKVDHITTLETYGFRYQVGAVGADGQFDMGDDCVVSTNQGTLGKLVSVNYTGETGLYEIVARVEQIIGQQIVFRTLSPVMITL